MTYFNKYWAVVVAVSLASFFSCATAFSAPLSEQSILTLAQIAFEKDSTAAVRDLEPMALEMAGGRASRKGGTLVLHRLNNQIIEYRNAPECGHTETEERCRLYTLVAYIPSVNKFLVLLSTYEGAEYILIDETDGTEARYSVMPLFSPGRKYILLTYVNDSELNFMLRIMRRSGRGYVLDWQGEPGTEGGSYTDYKLLTWSGDDEVCVKAETRLIVDYMKVIKKTYCLSHSVKGWKVSSVKGVDDR